MAGPARLLPGLRHGAFDSKSRDGRAHDVELLVSKEPSLLHEDDPRMDLARTSEPDEVVDVARDEDAIIEERPFQENVVRNAQQAAISNVDRIDAVLAAQSRGDRG